MVKHETFLTRKTENPAFILYLRPKYFWANNSNNEMNEWMLGVPRYAMDHQRMGYGICAGAIPTGMNAKKIKKFKLKPTFRTKFIGFSSQPVRQYYYLFFLPVRSHSNSFHPFRWFLFQFGCRSYFTDSQKKVDQRQRIERTEAEKKIVLKSCVCPPVRRRIAFHI